MSRIVFHLLLLFVCLAAPRESTAQPSAKKVRLGIQSNNIGFLPFHLAYHKGFYREQGIELETIFMATQAVNAAFVRGDIDYSAAINGIIQGVVRGNAAKILAWCAVDRH
jgi:ABC-type nitrate/sulfonate/bicarbonate transport system substrate-binding protein